MASSTALDKTIALSRWMPAPGGPSGAISGSLPDKVQACCGMVNRGFAALGERLFMATLDAHVVALDMKTGNVIWDVEAADYRQAYVFTVAPLVVKDKIIVGVAGGEYGVRGFIDAYYADTRQARLAILHRARPRRAWP